MVNSEVESKDRDAALAFTSLFTLHNSPFPKPYPNPLPEYRERGRDFTFAQRCLFSLYSYPRGHE